MNGIENRKVSSDAASVEVEASDATFNTVETITLGMSNASFDGSFSLKKLGFGLLGEGVVVSESRWSHFGVIAAFSGLVLLAALWRRRAARTRSRTDSGSVRNRLRSDSRSSRFVRGWNVSRSISRGLSRNGSEDYTERLDDTEFEQAFGTELQRRKGQVPRCRLAGPAAVTISYATVTPPPTWSQTSRRLIPHKTVWRLEKELVLTLKGVPTLTERDRRMRNSNTNDKPRRNPPIPVTNCGLLCTTPADSGALQVYSTQSSTAHEGTEHTFASAQLAAQFQTDLLSLQLAGPQIWTMYQAFRLVHQGSSAFIGKEVVIHDSTCHGFDKEGNEVQPSVSPGIAWDDVMRCLGSQFPGVARQLEDLWWHTFAGPSSSPNSDDKVSNKDGSGTVASASEEGASVQKITAPRRDTAISMLVSEYVGNRLLLGPVDFFRLFVPLLPAGAIPEGKTAKSRMETTLRWRKQVAQACRLVDAYTRARAVCNVGWTLEQPLPENYLKQRVAFDDNTDNRIRDTQAKDEYYEPTVGRDVLCQVRGLGSLRPRAFWGKAPKSPTSPYQGYTLLGKHVFSLDSSSARHVLDPSRDPVAAISSLQDLVAKSPDLDFFVLAVFGEAQKVASVEVFVRSLPKGVDASFDTVVHRYVNGGNVLRDRKLEVIIQLGVGRDGLSVLAQLGLFLVSVVLRITLGSYFCNTQMAPMNERTPFPALNLSRCGATRHFGGSLQQNRSLPNNYVATTLHIHSGGTKSFFARLLSKYIEMTLWKEQTVDLTLVLAGESRDELPERALGTSRVVRASVVDVALPLSFLSNDIYFENSDSDASRLLQQEPPSLFLKSYLADPLAAAVGPIIRYFRQLRKRSDSGQIRVRARTLSLHQSLQEQAHFVSSDDPVDQAIKDIVEILGEIKIPTRRDQALRLQDSDLRSVSQTEVGEQEEMIEVPLLSTTNRNDIRRHFVAAEGDLDLTCQRVIASAVWRGRMFPVDIRTCRVELQNGQFFQQGRDKEGNPVFYFRDTCLGPWRGDEDAVVASVIHRLEQALEKFSRSDPDVKYTMIVLLGKPFSNRQRRSGKSKLDDEASQGGMDTGEASTASSMGTPQSSVVHEGNAFSSGSVVSSSKSTRTRVSEMTNPRIFGDELWCKHSNRKVVERLIEVVISHYPERMSKALVVGHHRSVVKSSVRAMLRNSSINSPRFREKVRFFNRFRDLLSFVEQDELPSLVGGHQPIASSAFEAS